MKTLLYILSHLPIRVHEAIADYILYPLLYYVLRYRRKMVEKNLRLSFPDKSPAERQAIERGFYHQLCNTVVEVLYGYRLSEEQMRERVVFHGVEQVAEDALKKGGLIFMLGHVGNWDWIAEIQRELAPYGITECNVYRKQKSAFFDRLLLELRSKRGGFCADKNQLLRTMITERKSGRLVTYGLICDQKPQPRNSHFWTTFLHQNTSFLDGGEVLSKKFDYPVYYAWITCPRRGHYDIAIQLLTREPQSTAPGEISEAFARHLEDNIRLQPEIWLWTHNRWKWAKPEQA